MHWGSGVARVSAGLSGDKARSTSRGENGVALHRMSSDIQSTSMDGRAPSSIFYEMDQQSESAARTKLKYGTDLLIACNEIVHWLK